MKNVIELLKKAEGINGWRVTESATKSYELFFVHEVLETVRSTDTVDTEVTVYVEHDGSLGDSGFNVSPCTEVSSEPRRSSMWQTEQ